MSELLNNVRSRIESLGIGFQFVKTVKTGTNGAERETWLLEYEGSQFIFVPGRKHVTLGWGTDKCPLGEGVLEGHTAFYRHPVNESHLGLLKNYFCYRRIIRLP